MPNTQTSVPAFVAAQVLTAQQQTEINTGIPVFATTVTRDAAFGGAGEKALAEGQFAYIEATNTTQYYDGAAWQSVGASSGLTLVSATTIGTTVASVTVSNAFSTTYDAYKIILTGGTISAAAASLALTFGATATGYYAGANLVYYSTNVATSGANNNASSFSFAGWGMPNGLVFNVNVDNPFLAKNTLLYGNGSINRTNEYGGMWGGFLNDTTSYTAFTITPSSGTLTGGTIRVYGYANS
jgi:hypothetical protein